MKNKIASASSSRTLAVTVALALASTQVFAQSTTGSIFGQVPASGGDAVQVKSATGISRTVPIDSRGRYVAPELPLGVYTVSLLRHGAVIDSRSNVELRAGTETEARWTTYSYAATAIPKASCVPTSSRRHHRPASTGISPR